MSGYVMGVVLKQGGRHVCYHSEVFHEVILNYPTCNKELYALVKVLNKRKKYLMGKDIVIRTDHQPL